MKTLLVIKTHSFVDLITNSSSELFVCGTSKTKEAVEEVLRTLLANHSKLTGTVYEFGSVFGGIEVAPFSFDWNMVAADARAQWEKYHEHSVVDFEYQELQAKDALLHDKHKVNEAGRYEEDKVEHNRRWKVYRAESDAIWSPWGAKALEAEKLVFASFLQQNEFSSGAIKKANVAFNAAVKAHVKGKKGRWAYTGAVEAHLPEELKAVYSELSLLTSYNITVKKGDILVHSASDNSVPYELFDCIDSYLNAQRYHIG